MKKNNVEGLMLQVAALYAFLGALTTPTMVKLQGSMFNTKDLSVLFIVPIIFQALTMIMSKVPKNTGLYLPVILDIVLAPITVIIVKLNVQSYVVIEVIIGAMSMVMFFNRRGIILDSIADKISLQKFNNKTVTISSVSGAFGMIVSYWLSPIVTPQQLIIGAAVLSITGVPLMLEVNSIVKT